MPERPFIMTSEIKATLERLAYYYAGRAKTSERAENLNDAARWKAKEEAVLKVAENLYIQLDLGEKYANKKASQG